LAFTGDFDGSQAENIHAKAMLNHLESGRSDWLYGLGSTPFPLSDWQLLIHPINPILSSVFTSEVWFWRKKWLVCALIGRRKRQEAEEKSSHGEQILREAVMSCRYFKRVEERGYLDELCARYAPLSRYLPTFFGLPFQWSGSFE
jgi:hypothetical protein